MSAGTSASAAFEPEEGGYEVEMALDERVLDGVKDGYVLARLVFPVTLMTIIPTLLTADRASAYVDEHGTLRGMFEARLIKYMSDDCVIC